MSDEQTIYISPDDDLTTVRERLEQITSRKITLVIPSQTQLRSHVAWKLLSARARELNKEVLIVSSDPQVRSVAHAVKFKVAHSLESISNSGRSKSGNRAGTGRSTSSSSRSRPTASSPATITEKEPTSRRGASRSPRSTRPPLSGETSAWPDPSSFALPKRLDSPQSRFDEPHTVTPNESLSPRSKRSERSSRSNQIRDFRVEAPPAIHPVPINQIEEPDLLIEDYNQALDIRQAATGSHPILQGQEDTEPAIPPSDHSDTPIPGKGASFTHTNQSHRPHPRTYEQDDPFIYMQDDSPLPSQSEQKGEAILQDDDTSQGYPSLQKSAISDLPTNVVEKRTEYRDDEDDSIPPITPPPITQARPRDIPFNDEKEKVERKPSRRSTRPYAVPPRDNHYGPPLSRQTFNEDEDQLPGFPERPAPVQVPQPIPLPIPQEPKPPASTSRPTSPRTSGKIAPKAPLQKPGGAAARADSKSVIRDGSRTSQPARSRPATRPTQQHEDRSTGSRGALSPRRPAMRNRSRGSKRLYLVLASIIAIPIILFAVAYLNTTSTVKLTVVAQDYPHPVKLTLSDKNEPGIVPAKPVSRTFTKTGPEPATGTAMQGTSNSTGIVYFTNTGTTPVQIPSLTTVATTKNVNFVTTANVLILPQSANPVPVPIKASNQGMSGNVLARSITVIPQESLTSIALAQNPPVTAESLKTTLTVSNPTATTGGEAHQVPGVTQQDLDKAKQDLHDQLKGEIDAWVQQQHQNGLVGQPTNNEQLNAPNIDTPVPDTTFSATLNVTATILIARLDDAQKVAVNQLNEAVHADPNFGPAFAIIGDPQTIKIDQGQPDGNIVTANATAKVGHSLNTTDVQNSIKGKPFNEVEGTLRPKNPDIQTVDIQTQPGIFRWISPWIDHIYVTVQPKK